MAQIITLPTYADERGALTVLEKALPFDIKRVYWIYNLYDEKSRGGHRHKKTMQAMICLTGQCEVVVRKKAEETLFLLNKPDKVLLLEPEDWHEMRSFKNNALLLLMASHEYDAADYIHEALV